MDQDKTLALLALCALDGKPPKEQYWLLSRAGFTPADIGRLLGVDPKVVAARVSEMRKAAKK
jgi:hypothetical protein